MHEIYEILLLCTHVEQYACVHITRFQIPESMDFRDSEHNHPVGWDVQRGLKCIHCKDFMGVRPSEWLLLSPTQDSGCSPTETSMCPAMAPHHTPRALRSLETLSLFVQVTYNNFTSQMAYGSSSPSASRCSFWRCEPSHSTARGRHSRALKLCVAWRIWMQGSLRRTVSVMWADSLVLWWWLDLDFFLSFGDRSKPFDGCKHPEGCGFARGLKEIDAEWVCGRLALILLSF